ncbi:hypothetical protein BSKO_10441 [Bryopsis sp. KO-2023]|nr:hypothetical protein BSKO_10441 [Bryopsis sp. KO-2023]
MVGGCGETEDYEFEGLLGKGSFGEVYEATERKTGEKVAIKVITRSKLKSREARARLKNEYKIHSTVKHPNIVALKCSIQSSKKVFFVMEVCKQGELADLLKKKDRFVEGEARGYFRQLVEAVSYLHSRWIIHRDIKLANLLLTDGNVLKLADFGLAAQLDCQDSERLTICGTPNYLSPEIAKREPYTLATDVWSLGVVLYSMLCGTPPFQEDEVAETIERVKMVDFECPDFLSPEASDMIKGILHKEKSKRMKLKDIKRHPFYTGKSLEHDVSESLCEEETPRKSMPVTSTGSPVSGIGEFTPPNRVLPPLQSQSPVFRPEHPPFAKKWDPTATAWGTPTEGSPYQAGMFSPMISPPEKMDSTVEIGVTVGFRNSQNMVETQVGFRGGFGGSEISMDVENYHPEHFSFKTASPIQVLGNSQKANTQENRGFCRGMAEAVNYSGHTFDSPNRSISMASGKNDRKIAAGYANVEGLVSPDRFQSVGVLTSHSPCGGKTSPRPSVRIDLTEISSPRCKENHGERVGCIDGRDYGSPTTINNVNLVVTASPTGDELRSFSETVTFGVQGCPGGYQMVGNIDHWNGHCPEGELYHQPFKDLAVARESPCNVHRQGETNQGDVDRGGGQHTRYSEEEACFLEQGGSGREFSLNGGLSQDSDFERNISGQQSSRSEVGDFTMGLDESRGLYCEESANHGKDVTPGILPGEETVSCCGIEDGAYVSLAGNHPIGFGDLDGVDCQFYGEGNGPAHMDEIDSGFDPCSSQAFSIRSQGEGFSNRGEDLPKQSMHGFDGQGAGILDGSDEMVRQNQMVVMDPLASREGVEESSSGGEILGHGGASFGPWIDQKRMMDLQTYVEGLVGVGNDGLSKRQNPVIMEILYGALVGSQTVWGNECGENAGMDGMDGGLGQEQVRESQEESKEARMNRLRRRYAAWLPPERIKRILLESGMHVEDPFLTDPQFLGDFSCEQSEKIPEEYTGRVVKLPELPSLDPGGVENVESLSGVMINIYSDRDLTITRKDMSLEKRGLAPRPEGRLGFQQSPDHDLQFWHLGQHYSGENAHIMRDTLEHLAAGGDPAVMHKAGPYSSHIPYQDLDMRMCKPSSKQHNKMLSTHRLPHGYAWAPPHAGLQALVQLLPNKHVCVVTENDGKDTRFMIDPTGAEVCIEREPKVGEESPEPILKYSFPELPRCAMEAYQVACDFVQSIANGVMKIKYTAYYGVGTMFENGSLSLVLDGNHQRELGVSGLDLVDLPGERRIQVNHADGRSRQIPIQSGEGSDGSRYSIPESFVESLTQNEMRAIELIILCKGSCEDVSAQALDAERQGQHVSWPLNGVDRIDAT